MSSSVEEESHPTPLTTCCAETASESEVSDEVRGVVREVGPAMSCIKKRSVREQFILYSHPFLSINIKLTANYGPDCH
jgi:hypothetical protein